MLPETFLATADNDPSATQEIVHLVDDDPQFRQGLSLLLTSSGFHVKAYSSAEHFLAAYRPCDVECLLLDLRMPGMTGLELQAELAAHHVRLPMIVISAFAEAPSVVQAIKNGATDFLEKPIEKATLIAKVAESLRRDREEKSRLGDIQRRLARLTPREHQVLDLLLDARNTVQMARQLGVSSKTIEKHRVNIFDKLGVASVPELMRLLIR